jgi:hypothetical protein
VALTALMISGEELSAYEQLLAFFGMHVAYGLIMGTRPETVYGLADSPIDLAAFMLDHSDGAGQPGIVQQVLEEGARRPNLTSLAHYSLPESGAHFGSR